MNESRKKAFRLGTIIFLLLLLLTGIEFVVGIGFNSIALLFAMILLKAALIVYYFMHIYRLWREESHG